MSENNDQEEETHWGRSEAVCCDVLKASSERNCEGHPRFEAANTKNKNSKFLT